MISDNEAWGISRRLINTIKIRNSIETTDLPSQPEVNVYQDEYQYFDGRENEIHLGAYGPTRIFNAQDEDEYTSALLYFYGHENEHARCTAAKPWCWGINRSIEVVLEYISSQVEPLTRRFRSEDGSDCRYFVNKILPDLDIYLSYKALTDCARYIINCLEDGRIERIRALEYPGFQKQRRYFRGIDWNRDYHFMPYKTLANHPEEKWRVMSNQVRSLATTQLFQKGFLKAYSGTPIVQEVVNIIPLIGKGILAESTMEMAKASVEICTVLSPLIFEVAKIPDNSLEKIMCEMLRLLANALPKTLTLREQDEEKGSREPLSTFPTSDMNIVLDDETYDTLTEQGVISDSNQGSILVSREHPKKGKNHEKLSKEEADDIEEKEKGSSKSDACFDNEAQKPVKPDRMPDSISADQGKPDKEGNNEPMQEQKSHSGGSAHGSDLNGRFQEETVLEEMNTAASECRNEASAINETVNESSIHAGAVSSEQKDREPPINLRNIPGLGQKSFREFTRKYEVDDDLPPVLLARGRTLRRKNEKYFRSIRVPNISNLDAGLVDPSSIYSLAFGNTEIFRKPGKDKSFDGCVYMLIDNSGSMFGAKRSEACKAAAVIEEGFKGFIPIKITAFDASGDTVIHERIKNWEESLKKNCVWNFCLHGRNGQGNDDAVDIRVAKQELLKRPERKKLLIVLSDGAPYDVEDTKKAIKEARKAGITVVGIYFEEGAICRYSDFFKKMYVKDYICCPLKDLDSNLNKILLKFSRS